MLAVKVGESEIHSPQEPDQSVTAPKRKESSLHWPTEVPYRADGGLAAPATSTWNLGNGIVFWKGIRITIPPLHPEPAASWRQALDCIPFSARLLSGGSDLRMAPSELAKCTRAPIPNADNNVERIWKPVFSNNLGTSKHPRGIQKRLTMSRPAPITPERCNLHAMRRNPTRTQTPLFCNLEANPL
jgi:hypothetical protein